MTTFKQDLTTAFIKKITPPAKGRDYYYDQTEKGLVLDITHKGSKSFYLYKKVNGRPTRVYIADANDVGIKEARDMASAIKAEIRSGKNPNDEKKKFRQEATLKELFEEFMERYSKPQKKSWTYDESEIPDKFGHWFSRKISDITKQQIQKLCEEIAKSRGQYAANRSLERIKSMYNRALEWGWDGTNPAVGIRKYKEVKRDRFVQPNEFPAFFRALDEEPNIEAKNYIWMSLLTGARRNNVLSMRWDEIDFQLKMWRIPDTKNGEPLNVPLVDAAIQLLNSISRTSEWIFPSATSKSGHLQDPKKPWERILAKANISNLRIHDIRRTLGSYQAIMGSSLNIIGKSLGQKTIEATQIYARLNQDPVRASMDTAINKMLEFKE